MKVLRRRRLNRHPHDEMAWQDASFMSIDLETTGLDLRSDQIVSVGVAPITACTINPAAAYYSLMRPSCPVSASSIEIHGITAGTLAIAPEPHTVATLLRKQVGETPVVAHASWVEKAFLGRLAASTGEPLPQPTIDTASLCRAAGLHDERDNREPDLELMANRLVLPVFATHHALGDALTTAVVFLALASRLQAARGVPLTVAELRAISHEHSH